MSTVEQVIKYVTHSPENTNPFILKQLIEGVEGTNIPGTIVYKGSLSTMEDLPPASEENFGQSYIILENRHQVLSDGKAWIDLDAGLDDKVSYDEPDLIINGGNASNQEV